MRVVLFTIGNYEVHSYGVVVALAVLLAMGMARYLAEGTSYREHIWNMIPYVIAGAVVFARIWHVFFFQWEYYSRHFVEIFYIWQGGIAIQGALIEGLQPQSFIRRSIDCRSGRWRTCLPRPSY